MSLLTIVEASKQFNITRSRIYRALEKGTITAQIDADGVKRIDPTDMIRVFSGRKKTRTTTEAKKTGVSEQNEMIVEMLKEQLKQAQDREQKLFNEIASIRKDFDDYKALITYQMPVSPPTPPEQPEAKRTSLDNESDASDTAQAIQRNDIGRTDQSTQKSDQRAAPKKHGLFGRMIRTLIDD